MKHIRKAVILLAAVLCPACAAEEKTEEPQEPVSYENASVSYLGPEGTYTQEACQRFFEGRGTYTPCATVEEAVGALVSGQTGYAVIPQENTIGGAVNDYVDILIARGSVSVVGEAELPVSQNLLVRKGTEKEDIRIVYSHRQGIEQGKEWLKENLPDAQVIEVASTALGARMVSEQEDTSCAAIASAAAAGVYGLEIFASDIQNSDANKTRFYVLSNGEPSTASSDRLAFIADGAAKDLPALMARMEKEKMTLVTIHVRPLKTELGQYHYLVECSDCSYSDYLKLTEKCPFAFRYLGSFNVR